VKALFFAWPLIGYAVLVSPCRADPAEAERQTQLQLLQRDRQAAEFSRPQLRDMPRRSDAEPLRPDERTLRARERDAYLLGASPAPQAPVPSEPPLPLPGGVGHVVDPIPVQGSSR
jgi:hypothetical protein